MDEEKKELEQQDVEQTPIEEGTVFVPSPMWKRVAAWILFGIVILGTINWLVSIAFPQWPQWLMEQFR